MTVIVFYNSVKAFFCRNLIIIPGRFAGKLIKQFKVNLDLKATTSNAFYQVLIAMHYIRWIVEIFISIIPVKFHLKIFPPI